MKNFRLVGDIKCLIEDKSFNRALELISQVPNNTEKAGLLKQIYFGCISENLFVAALKSIRAMPRLPERLECANNYLRLCDDNGWTRRKQEVEEIVKT